MADLIRRSDVIGLLEDMLLFGEYDIIASSFSKADEEKAYQAINDIPSVNRWISVEDALPEQSAEGQPPNVKCSDCVLVAACNWIGMAYYVTKGEESQWLFADAQNKPKIDWTVVTHWMPIPEIPEPPESEVQHD